MLAVDGEDVVVAGIFSRIPPGAVRKTWVLLDDARPDFPRTGLKKTSVLKATKLAVAHESILVRKLGSLSPALAELVQQALRTALHL